jgi:hypothetical protein
VARGGGAVKRRVQVGRAVAVVPHRVLLVRHRLSRHHHHHHHFFPLLVLPLVPALVWAPGSVPVPVRVASLVPLAVLVVDLWVRLAPPPPPPPPPPPLLAPLWTCPR